MTFSTPWLINETVTHGKGEAGRAKGMDGGGVGRVGTLVIAPLLISATVALVAVK